MPTPGLPLTPAPPAHSMRSSHAAVLNVLQSGCAAQPVCCRCQMLPYAAPRPPEAAQARPVVLLLRKGAQCCTFALEACGHCKGTTRGRQHGEGRLRSCTAGLETEVGRRPCGSSLRCWPVEQGGGSEQWLTKQVRVECKASQLGLSWSEVLCHVW